MGKILRYGLIGLTALSLNVFYPRNGYSLPTDTFPSDSFIPKEVIERGFELVENEYEIIGKGEHAYARSIGPDREFQIIRYRPRLNKEIARALSCTLDREVTIGELREINNHVKINGKDVLLFRDIKDVTIMDLEW